jgi:hypothetical protein
VCSAPTTGNSGPTSMGAHRRRCRSRIPVSRSRHRRRVSRIRCYTRPRTTRKSSAHLANACTRALACPPPWWKRKPAHGWQCNPPRSRRGRRCHRATLHFDAFPEYAASVSPRCASTAAWIGRRLNVCRRPPLLELKARMVLYIFLDSHPSFFGIFWEKDVGGLSDADVLRDSEIVLT